MFYKLLRHYFAGKAMQAMLAGTIYSALCSKYKVEPYMINVIISQASYEIADRMITQSKVSANA